MVVLSELNRVVCAVGVLEDQMGSFVDAEELDVQFGVDDRATRIELAVDDCAELAVCGFLNGNLG